MYRYLHFYYRLYLCSYISASHPTSLPTASLRGPHGSRVFHSVLAFGVRPSESLPSPVRRDHSWGNPLRSSRSSHCFRFTRWKPRSLFSVSLPAYMQQGLVFCWGQSPAWDSSLDMGIGPHFPRSCTFLSPSFYLYSINLVNLR